MKIQDTNKKGLDTKKLSEEMPLSDEKDFSNDKVQRQSRNWKARIGYQKTGCSP